MKKNRYLNIVMVLILAMFSFSTGLYPAFSQNNGNGNGNGKKDPNAVLTRMKNRVTNAQRKEAAARAAANRPAGKKGPTPIGASSSAIVSSGPMSKLVSTTNAIVSSAPMPTLVSTTPDYYGGVTPNWAWTPLLRKFVDSLPGLYINGINTVVDANNNLGQYIPVAVPDAVWALPL